MEPKSKLYHALDGVLRSKGGGGETKCPNVPSGREPSRCKGAAGKELSPMERY